ncbi:MerR-like helix-turn-helix DNA binding domain protein [Streptomyces phage Coruscant]|uniref:MerR-like helix-turn-helix DNA binding domain protein n=1 Tax=Streptomyces phage Coruscant TaxID=2739834 RepID=A0A7G4AW13_9CAUD|nr:MerR-like helix-turn-helix DNA binding domain protein [Streptomyces phage Coruscant]QMP84203.1 MerR-like helix-turn-helix DNA binding domain protein [Streptomyces phage Coruscant]
MKKKKSWKWKNRPADNYFFINGVAHKKLQVNRSTDMLTAWNYEERKVVSYIWSITKRSLEKVYLSGQVEDMFGFTRQTILSYIKNGLIPAPYRTLNIRNPEKKGSGSIYLWRESDILGLHDALIARGGPGRPRQDGTPSAYNNLPSKAEILAMMRNEVVLYAKTKEGEFKPVWQAHDW